MQASTPPSTTHRFPHRFLHHAGIQAVAINCSVCWQLRRSLKLVNKATSTLRLLYANWKKTLPLGSLQKECFCLQKLSWNPAPFTPAHMGQ